MGPGDVFRRYLEGAAGIASKMEEALHDVISPDRSRDSSVQSKVESLFQESKRSGEAAAKRFGGELNDQLRSFGFSGAEEVGEVLQRLGALAMSLGATISESAERASPGQQDQAAQDQAAQDKADRDKAAQDQAAQDQAAQDKADRDKAGAGEAQEGTTSASETKAQRRPRAKPRSSTEPKGRQAASKPATPKAPTSASRRSSTRSRTKGAAGTEQSKPAAGTEEPRAGQG